MCGIAGALELKNQIPDRDRLRKMISVLSHRGPDGSGIAASGPMGLAHARLSIIDLEGGRQPMSIENGKLWISFNGEIFNYIELREELVRKGHRFATRSDTEVILHLYREEGEDCVRRLNGQWAFAIWDSEQQKLFLSRDRFGVRPLFYTHSDARFLFASEIKSLLTWTEVDAELDLRALDQIFTVWVTIPPRTAFRNILQLPPGHSLVVKDGKIEIRQYWRLEYAPENEGAQGTEKKLAEELLSLLLDATRIRLRSDVPVGAYLSGGLDSTLITALTKSLVGERLRTFSISFEDPTFDESPYQREASAFFGTQHSDVRCSYENIARIFPDVIWHCEQPILRTAPVPMFLLARLVRESGFKVVLTGEGADETMGGYDVFKEAKIRRFWARHPESRIRPMLLKRLYPYMDAMQRQPAAYLKTFFRITDEDLGSPFFSHLPRWELTARLKAFFSEEVRKELEFYTTTDDLARELPSNYGSWSAFNQAEFLEAQYLMPGYILSSQGDRMAMAHSVEGRYPFLDYRLVEFSAKLPANLKMKVLDQKHLLKLAADGSIPTSIRKRHKQPYRAPDGRSFFCGATSYIEEALSPGEITKRGVFDPQMVSALVSKFKASRTTSMKDDMALVGILSTQLILDQFGSRSRSACLSLPHHSALQVA